MLKLLSYLILPILFIFLNLKILTIVDKLPTDQVRIFMMYYVVSYITWSVTLLGWYKETDNGSKYKG